MKNKVVLIVLFLVLSLSACGKNEQDSYSAQLFSAEDPAWVIRAKIENAVRGVTRGDILTEWGEPDSMLSGIFGDIYKTEGGWVVLLLYGGKYGTEDAYVSSVQIGNMDETMEFSVCYTYPDTNIKEDPFSSPGVWLNGQTGQCSLGLPAKSSYMAVGEYSMAGDKLRIVTYDNKYYFTFRFDGENLIFDQESSSDLDWYAKLPDGAVFVPEE